MTASPGIFLATAAWLLIGVPALTFMAGVLGYSPVLVGLTASGGGVLVAGWKSADHEAQARHETRDHHDRSSPQAGR